MAIVGYQIGPTVMMQLGSFQFGIATATYQQLQRSTEWRWPAQDQFGRMPALQYTGPDADTITLPGVIFPEWNGGVVQLDVMRSMGETGQPHDLVDGSGISLGRWVIERVDEGQSVFAARGVPRRVEFTLHLRRVEGEGAATVIIANPAAAAGVTIPATATTPVAQVEALSTSVAENAGEASNALTRAADRVQEFVAPVSEVAREALGAVNRSLEVMNEVANLANMALKAVGVKPIDTTALLSAEVMAAGANRALRRAESASAILRTSGERLGQIPGVPPSATRAMQAAQAAADVAAKVTRDTAKQAGTIKAGG